MSTPLDPHPYGAAGHDPAAYAQTSTFDAAELAAQAQPQAGYPAHPVGFAPVPPAPPVPPAGGGQGGSGGRLLVAVLAVGAVVLLVGAAAFVFAGRSGGAAVDAEVAAARRAAGLGSLAPGAADQLVPEAGPGDLPVEVPADVTVPVGPPTTADPVPSNGQGQAAGPGQGAGQSAGQGQGQPGSGGPTTTTTTPAKVPPKITSFSLPKEVDCSVVPATPSISVSWVTTGATEVTLSIDGPGAYKTYAGASGSDTVPFACPGPHTYTIVAKGPGGMTTQQVTVKPKLVAKNPNIPDPVVPIAPNGGGDDGDADQGASSPGQLPVQVGPRR